MSQYALKSKRLGKLMRDARHIVLGLDFDGTLTPIIKDPGKAHLGKDVKELLKMISRNRRITLAVISGRALSDVIHRVGLRNIFYSGNHGFEVYAPARGIIIRYGHLAYENMVKIGRVLAKELLKIPKIIIEQKGITSSVHYRAVNEKFIPEILEITRNVRRKIDPSVRLTYGKKVVEIRPSINAINKGEAFRFIANSVKAGGKLLVYIGDDKTDEDAFNLLKRRGVGIYVGSKLHNTSAHFYLKDTNDVKVFLASLL